MAPKDEGHLEEAFLPDYDDLLSNHDGDKDFVAALLKVFLSDCPKTLRRLETAVASEDIPAARSAAHSLANILGAVYCRECISFVHDVSGSLRAGDLPAARERLSALRIGIEAAIRNVTLYLEKG